MPATPVEVRKWFRSRGHWGSHKDYPAEQWRYEVSNDDTRLGYRAWAINEAEKAQEEKLSG